MDLCAQYSLSLCLLLCFYGDDFKPRGPPIKRWRTDNNKAENRSLKGPTQTIGNDSPNSCASIKLYEETK